MDYHPEFETIRTERIQPFELVLHDFVHKPSNLRHVHLQAQDDNNVFLALFKTPASDNTGVSHVLEHMVLCGSERYPVHDAFFAMTNRSVNTGMNAFATPDCSGFHFSTRYKTDFDNLLNVYLDGLFFPLLDSVTFAREGVRVDIADNGNPIFNGVVFNEMKGALNDSNERMKMLMRAQLFPQSRYCFNEGGDPLAMINLTVDHIQAFHRRHYHPANAIFITYGDRPARNHQEKFITNVLERLQSTQQTEMSLADISVPRQPTDNNTTTETMAGENECLVAWRIGHAFNSAIGLRGRLLQQLLVDEKSSPFRRILLERGIRPISGPLTGWNGECMDITFSLHCALDFPPPHESPVSFMQEALSEIRAGTFSPQVIKKAFDKTELDWLDLNSSRETPGLKLIRRMVPALLYETDASASLNIYNYLLQLRTDCNDPAFIPALIENYLIDNKRCFSSYRTSVRKNSSACATLERRLKMIWQEMDDNTRADCWRVSDLLKQQTNIEADLLPILKIDQVQPRTTNIHVEHVSTGKHSLYFASRGANDITDLSIAFDLKGIAPDLIDYLPVYVTWLDRLETSDAVAWDFESELVVLSTDKRVVSALIVHGKSLSKDTRSLFNAIWDLAAATQSASIDVNYSLMSDTYKRIGSSLHRQGHEHAMRLAASSLNEGANLENRLNGLAALGNLRDKRTNENVSSENLRQKINRIGEHLANTKRSILFVGREDQLAGIQTFLETLSAPSDRMDITTEYEANSVKSNVWLLDTDVNYCAQAVLCNNTTDHREMASLYLLAALIDVGFLRQIIRHQGGAYGAGAKFDPTSRTLKMFSYRDPRLVETMLDFDNAWQWLSGDDVSQYLEQAKLTALAIEERNSLNDSASARRRFFDALGNLPPDFRNQFKQAITDLTFEEIKANKNRLLYPNRHGYGVITDFRNETLLKEKGYKL